MMYRERFSLTSKPYNSEATPAEIAHVKPRLTGALNWACGSAPVDSSASKLRGESTEKPMCSCLGSLALQKRHIHPYDITFSDVTSYILASLHLFHGGSQVFLNLEVPSKISVGLGT